MVPSQYTVNDCMLYNRCCCFFSCYAESQHLDALMLKERKQLCFMDSGYISVFLVRIFFSKIRFMIQRTMSSAMLCDVAINKLIDMHRFFV